MLEELQESLDYEEKEEFSEQDAKSVDSSPHRTFRSSSVDTHTPDRVKMEDHWELYKEFGLIRASIRGFASEVISPGYFVDAENEEVREELEDWLEQCAIISGEHDKDFREVAKKSTIQREVRGTALIEKVPTKDNNLYGFKMVNPEWIKAYTKPGQAILLEPDEDIERLDELYEDFDPNKIKVTEDGEVAAYVQWDRSLSAYRDSNKPEIPFTKDQIIKLTRDEDVGEIWGNSRLESVKGRAESLLEKLENNDDAIRATAHPFWLFKMGDPEDPWTEDEIKEFMSNHEGDEFKPGMKQAVQGNIDLDTYSGDVAEIEEFLDFDVDMIMAEMPIPKYALGAFEENVNQFVSRSQETELRKQVKEARKEIESEFTPVLKEKAAELGHSEDAVNGLRIATPPEERQQEGEDGEGNEGAENGAQDGDNVSPGGFGGSTEDDDGEDEEGNGDPETDFTRPPASSEMSEFWKQDLQEFYDPWSVSETQDLKNVTEQFFKEVRDSVLLELERHEDLLNNRSVSREGRARNIERVIENLVQRAGRSFNLEETAISTFEEVLEDEVEEFEDGSYGSSQSVDADEVRNYSSNYRNSVMDVVEEFGKAIRTEFRRAYNRGEDVHEASERVRSQFNDDNLSQRAGIISMMEVHSARQSARLERFEKSDRIVGYRVVNENPSTSLTESLDGTEVYFDEGDYVNQISEQVSESLLPNGFSPPPKVPPFRFGDSSQIEPIFEDDV